MSGFSYSEDGMGGEGSIKDFFTQRPLGDPEVEALQSEFFPGIEERDDAVDRLCIQLFTEFSGLKPEDRIEVIWPEIYGAWNEETGESATIDVVKVYNDLRNQPGLVMIGWQPDDAILALFRDGQPIAAFYASYRGAYQAGGFVAKTNTMYFAHDAFTEEFAGPMNVWQSGRDTTCGQVARDFLMEGPRVYDNEE